MFKVVLSGGPSSGKTSCLNEITKRLQEKGFVVLICSETATEMLNFGFKINKNISLADFEDILIRQQMFKEDMLEEMAKKLYDTTKTVIIYDRGLLDIAAYLPAKEYYSLLEKYNMKVCDVINRYDLILHLLTAAKGTDYYDTTNNPARYETADEAVKSDDRTLQSNIRHPHLKIIGNYDDFDEKINKAVGTILNYIKTNEKEIERKFLIKRPTKDDMMSLPYIYGADIKQIYLFPLTGGERRVRKRGNSANGYNYYYTEKRKLKGIIREEKEKIIDEHLYRWHEEELNIPDEHIINKTRYTFIYKDKVFELDIYPFTKKYAILEVELEEEDEEILFPDFIKVIKDVSTDDKYKNISIKETLQEGEKNA